MHKSTYVTKTFTLYPTKLILKIKLSKLHDLQVKTLIIKS